MIVFGPWAFGTTQSWSIWTMRAAGYLLGVFWLRKCGPVWRQKVPAPASRPTQPVKRRAGSYHLCIGCTAVLGVLTVALLLYCLISAINARAAFKPQTL